MSRVLIVDDEADNRDLIVKVLSKEGMEVYEAENGEEALQMLASKEIDLILMDLMMPVMDGFETITHIRQTKSSRLPIITISAINDQGAIMQAKRLGADDYLTKPYDLVTMVQAVKGALKC